MPRVHFFRSDGGLPPPRFIPLLCAALLISCGGDSPVAPVTDVAPDDPVVEAGTTSSVQDLLSDPLFLSLLDDVDDPELASVLRQSVQALTAGQWPEAERLLTEASTKAEALADRSEVSLETVIVWSVLDRYFAAAGLI